MSQSIQIEPLTRSAFRPFGDVLDAAGEPDRIINRGACGRWHDLANLEIGDGGPDDEGRPGISLFKAEPRTLPYKLDMMERHPLGSQAFLPMSESPFLVVVAPDEDGAPGRPRAFMTGAGQGVNYHPAVWHGVLTPLHPPGLFAVIDRIGPGANLEEHWFDQSFTVA
ncbi:MAG: ureidoglycolate lyase [Pseudomonadota bacterium]